MASTARAMNKKKKFVNDGLVHSELNEFFQRELAEDGYSGCELRQTAKRTEIVIKATSTTNIIGPFGRRINELTSLVRKRFGFQEKKVELFVQRVGAKGLCAIAQAEALKYKLLEGLAVRRAAYAVLRQVMNAGAKGCEVVISGKLRAARAKSMKFSDGFMIHSGQPTKDYIDRAVRHVMLRQGVLGVKVKIMLPHDPQGLIGPSKPLPDHIIIQEAKDEGEILQEAKVESFKSSATASAKPPTEQAQVNYPENQIKSERHANAEHPKVDFRPQQPVIPQQNFGEKDVSSDFNPSKVSEVETARWM
ncbi:40S ribosomal protein S3 [Coelomomyces lativittatus]|nr:40S ribosomal protein S3 [Coelomomyces lativittatus]KAJ1512578.1 40S ribosomal protein S3 [Coelomomyces lativittatus]KAJ1518424.1 40S ribosomal protein S3 [Coelomomyces lativittatus]